MAGFTNPFDFDYENARPGTVASAIGGIFGMGGPPGGQQYAAYGQQDNADLSPKRSGTLRGREALQPLIDQAADKYGLPRDLLTRFVQTESDFNPDTISPKNRKYHGLLQLSHKEFGALGGKNIYDPAENLDVGARKLAREVQEYRASYGKDPTFNDLYMVHQQGAAGYNAHKANPEGTAWKNIRRFYDSDQIAQDAVWINLPASERARLGNVNNVRSKDLVNAWARVNGLTPIQLAGATAQGQAIPGQESSGNPATDAVNAESSRGPTSPVQRAVNAAIAQTAGPDIVENSGNPFDSAVQTPLPQQVAAATPASPIVTGSNPTRPPQYAQAQGRTMPDYGNNPFSGVVPAPEMIERPGTVNAMFQRWRGVPTQKQFEVGLEQSNKRLESEATAEIFKAAEQIRQQNPNANSTDVIRQLIQTPAFSQNMLRIDATRMKDVLISASGAGQQPPLKNVELGQGTTQRFIDQTTGRPVASMDFTAPETDAPHVKEMKAILALPPQDQAKYLQFWQIMHAKDPSDKAKAVNWLVQNGVIPEEAGKNILAERFTITNDQGTGVMMHDKGTQQSWQVAPPIAPNMPGSWGTPLPAPGPAGTRPTGVPGAPVTPPGQPGGQGSNPMGGGPVNPGAPPVSASIAGGGSAQPDLPPELTPTQPPAGVDPGAAALGPRAQAVPTDRAQTASGAPPIQTQRFSPTGQPVDSRGYPYYAGDIQLPNMAKMVHGFGPLQTAGDFLAGVTQNIPGKEGAGEQNQIYRQKAMQTNNTLHKLFKESRHLKEEYKDAAAMIPNPSNMDSSPTRAANGYIGVRLLLEKSLDTQMNIRDDFTKPFAPQVRRDASAKIAELLNVLSFMPKLDDLVAERNALVSGTSGNNGGVGVIKDVLPTTKQVTDFATGAGTAVGEAVSPGAQNPYAGFTLEQLKKVDRSDPRVRALVQQRAEQLVEEEQNTKIRKQTGGPVVPLSK